jgi:ubiquitin carboxyl-terminal hydrolase 1
MTTTSSTPHQSILSSLSYLLSDSAVGQLAPIVVLLAVPLLVLYGQNYFREFALQMLAVASSALPWNWSSIYEHGPLSPNPKKKLPIRTRAEQLAARTDARSGACCAARSSYKRAHFDNISNLPVTPSDGEKSLFYPGLVNISGTYCFMNSTMQVRPPRRSTSFRPSGHLTHYSPVRYRPSPLCHIYNRT